MPNTNLSDITIVLDRSGSMEDIRKDTIGGFNAFVKQQKEGPGECRLTLIQFDTQDPYEIVHDGLKVADVPELTMETFVPRAATPLLDCLGRAIISTGQRFAGLPEDQRPAHVFFVIVTDGQENSSREYTKARISEMVKEQTEKWKWHFVYLGADHDAIAEAGDMGINTANAMNYAKSAKGVAGMYAASGQNVNKVRRGTSQTMSFDDSQRAESMSQ